MADSTVDQTVTGPSDTLDKLHSKLGQLSALLNCIYGEGGESFRSYNHVIQDNYLWACADLSMECELLAEQLTPTVWADAEAKIKAEVQHG